MSAGVAACYSPVSHSCRHVHQRQSLVWERRPLKINAAGAKRGMGGWRQGRGFDRVTLTAARKKGSKGIKDSGQLHGVIMGVVEAGRARETWLRNDAPFRPPTLERDACIEVRLG